ncbi:MAG: glycosyltransferase family 39 protein [Verrucomicrobia bacterium]|nr:glycosyltransferase family 39 protein [Verrucomicrobiota bacterium]
MAPVKYSRQRTAGSFGRRVKGVAVEKTARPTQRWAVRLGALAIVVVAFVVRFAGLSNDLDEGRIYHPDTPKQIKMAERFLDGHYYYRSKPPDFNIDGYPYFMMHLVEWEWRAITGVYGSVLYVMGWEREIRAPNDYADLATKLFALARLTVCLMSALAVYVIYRIGLEVWGPIAGLVGSGLAALSWLTVETAHYAMPDAVMDLFVCLTVLVGLRMYRARARLVYAALGGVLAAVSFAAKYNGAIVGIYVLVLHVLKYASPRRLVGRQAIRALGLIAAGAIVGVLLAIPSLLIYPDRVVKDIADFMQRASEFREAPAAVASGEQSLLGHAAAENFPVLWRASGIVAIGAAAGFIGSAFRTRRYMLPGLFVLLYLAVLLVSSKVVKPYYFSIVTLFFCLYAGVATHLLAGLTKKLRVPGIAVGAAFAGVMAVVSLVQVVRIDFFFWHQSSRRVATEWINENIPRAFFVQEGPYALHSANRSVEHANATASDGDGKPAAVETLAIAASSTRTPEHIPEGSVPLKTFEFEAKEPLTWFRNPARVDVLLVPTSKHLRPGFTMPVYQRLPSETGNEFVVPDGAEFVRTSRMMNLRPRATRRIYIMPERPEEVVVALRNGETGNIVALALGGPKREVGLAPLETRVIRIEGPKRIGLIGRPFYAFWARAPYACRAEVAVTDEQKGVLYFNAGMYKAAVPHLVAAWAETKSPALAQMALIAARCEGVDLNEIEKAAGLVDAVRADLAHGGESFFKRFGISSFYLDELPYMALEAEAMSREVARRYTRHDCTASGDTCVMPGPTEGVEWSARLAGLFLEPGAYRITLRARLDEAGASPATMRVAVVDVTGEIVYDEAVLTLDELTRPAYGEVACTLNLGERRGPVALRLAADPTLPLRIDTVAIKPDFAATVAARDALVRAMLDEDFAGLKPVPQDAEALLAFAHEAEGRGEVELAVDASAKAIEADAGGYGPYELLWRIREHLPEARRAELLARLDEARTAHARPDETRVSVRFKNGVQLTGWRLSAGEYAPGDTVELTLHWDTAPSAASELAGRWLFVHFVPAGGPKDVHGFQGDTEIVQDFGFDERLDRVRPLYRHRIHIPEDVEPGTYEIEVGILINMHDKRIRIAAAGVPHTNNSATIGTVRVVKRAPL